MSLDKKLLTIGAGSLPIHGNIKKYRSGSIDYALDIKSEDAEYFKKIQREITLRAIPFFDLFPYVQDDMTRMFLSPLAELNGGLIYSGDSYESSSIRNYPREELEFLEMIFGERYHETRPELRLKRFWPEESPDNAILFLTDDYEIPEVKFIKEEAQKFCEITGRESIEYVVPLSDPFLLVSCIEPKPAISFFDDIIDIQIKYGKKAHSNNKYCRMAGIVIDAPTYQYLPANLTLNKVTEAWDRIYKAISCDWKGLHIHQDEPDPRIFSSQWNILMPHIGADPDPELMREHDKFLRAPIMTTDLDKLLPEGEESKLAWDRIKGNRRHSGEWIVYIEPEDLMVKRLRDYIKDYSGRIPLVGPECGQGSWENQEFAITALRRMHRAVEKFNNDFF